MHEFRFDLDLFADSLVSNIFVGFETLIIVPNLEPLSNRTRSWPTNLIYEWILETLISAIFMSLSTLLPTRNSFYFGHTSLSYSLTIFKLPSQRLRSKICITLAGALFRDSRIIYSWSLGSSKSRIWNNLYLILFSKGSLQSSHSRDFQK